MDARGCCQRCGARLRRSNTTELCDPCARRPAPEVLLPVEFFTSARMRARLGNYDFARVFKSVRLASGYTQQRLGELIELTQSRISEIECGAHRLRDIAVVARFASRVGIPAELLGFSLNPAVVDGVTVDRAGHRDTVLKVISMLRRDFFGAFSAVTMGVAGLDLDRLDALLPQLGQEPPPRRIGAGDVAAINQVTDAFRASHHQYGGGAARDAAVAQVGYALNLRDSECSEQVRSEMHLATASLANTAGWMSCEAGRHHDARRLWMIAVTTAREAEHPHSSDLMVAIVMNTVSQALHLGDTGEALGLISYATAQTARNTAPVSASTRSLVPLYLASGEATLGQAQECRRALEEAGQIIADADPADAPPWSANIDAAGYAGCRGRALFQLSMTDPGYAPESIEHLRAALDAYSPARVTHRAQILPALAGSYAQAGDLDTALTLGHESVTLAESVHSITPHLRLRNLDTVLQPHHHRPEVTELRRRIHQTTAPTPV